MTLFTSVFTNPVRSAEQVAKTKLRVFVWVLIHVAFTTLALYSLFSSVNGMLQEETLSFRAILASSALVYFIGVVYPSIYLYNMHKLLKRYE